MLEKKGDTRTKGIRRYLKSKFLFIKTINESVSTKGTRLTKENKIKSDALKMYLINSLLS
tara:strand:- start:409 stop:588 length:180 start_codon:yes stop_codon:yes gene_type:complete